MKNSIVDYLQYSKPQSEQRIPESYDKSISPVSFYKRGYQDSLGRRVYFGNPNSKKALFVLSGRALHNTREVGWDTAGYLSNELSEGAIVSRIDWAVTDMDESADRTPNTIAELFSKGLVEGTLVTGGCKTVSRVDVGQPVDVETTYIGDIKRRGTKGIFRAYNKALESGLGGGYATRFELEERKKNAQTSAKRYTNGHSIESIIKSRIEFNSVSMKQLFDAPNIDTTRGIGLIPDESDEIIAKRWAWLMEQVAPALRKSVISDREGGLGDDRLIAFLEKSGIVVISD